MLERHRPNGKKVSFETVLPLIIEVGAVGSDSDDPADSTRSPPRKRRKRSTATTSMREDSEATSNYGDSEAASNHDNSEAEPGAVDQHESKAASDHEDIDATSDHEDIDATSGHEDVEAASDPEHTTPAIGSINPVHHGESGAPQSPHHGSDTTMGDEPGGEAPVQHGEAGIESGRRSHSPERSDSGQPVQGGGTPITHPKLSRLTPTFQKLHHRWHRRLTMSMQYPNFLTPFPTFRNFLRTKPLTTPSKRGRKPAPTNRSPILNICDRLSTHDF